MKLLVRRSHRVYVMPSIRGKKKCSQKPGSRGSDISRACQEGDSMEKIGLDLDQRMVISEAGLRENFRKYVERIAGRRSLGSFIWPKCVAGIISNSFWGS